MVAELPYKHPIAEGMLTQVVLSAMPSSFCVGDDGTLRYPEVREFDWAVADFGRRPDLLGTSMVDVSTLNAAFDGLTYSRSGRSPSVDKLRTLSSTYGSSVVAANGGCSIQIPRRALTDIDCCALIGQMLVPFRGMRIWLLVKLE